MWFPSDFHKINCMLKACACLTEENSLKKNRGSYMSAHVLLNFILNQLWKRDKMRGLPSI